MSNSVMTLSLLILSTLWIYSLKITINYKNSIGFKLAICW
jgi:hypothetical protein